MLRQDPNLPLTSLVGKEADATDFFNKNVLSVVSPRRRAASVDRVKVDWTPGQKYSAVYELRLDGPTEMPPVQAVISFDRESGKLANLYERNYGAGFANGNDAQPPAVFLQDLNCLIEFFPYDWALPSLPHVTSPDKMLPFLVAALCDQSGPDGWRCDVSALRHTPHNRCVLRYELLARESDFRQVAIGKVYESSTAAANVFANLCGLYVASADQELATPRPLAYVDSMNLLLMEEVNGTPMKRLLRKGANPESMARTAATALATFHGLGFEGREARSLYGDLRRFRRSVDRIHTVAPKLALRVEAIFDRARRLADMLEDIRPCPIHGAFRPSHLILDDGRVVLIDLDGAGIGDPAVDVAGFMSKCAEDGQILKEDPAATLPEYFLAEYQAHADADNGLADRARLYCSLSLIKRAVRGLLRAAHETDKKDRFSRSAVMIEEAAAWLDRVK